MTKRYWKSLGTKTLFSHPRLTVVEDEVLLPTGTVTTYMRYEALPDYVTVIPVKGNYVALIREYSYPHNEWLYQFPEGSIEPGETALQTAERELMEEAGLQSADMVQIGDNYDHHRRTTARNYIFLARQPILIQKSGGDEEEFGTELHWFSNDQLKVMVRNGQMKQKNALAALVLYFIANR